MSSPIFLIYTLFYFSFIGEGVVLHGRYTRNVENYELLVPRKLTNDGNFLTFALPHFFKSVHRPKRSLSEDDKVNYGVVVGGIDHHVELLPNHDLISPNAILERRNPNLKVQEMEFEKLGDKRRCHYRGKIKGIEDSNVALSTCEGLAGYIRIGGQRYFIEPLSEHVPNKRGQHLHMVYARSDKLDKHYKGPHCGTHEDWKEAWKKRFRERLSEDGPIVENKRGVESMHRYLELLIVADKKFLEHHKNTDMELYIMTIMNMVSDFYHDASVGNLIDVSVVRIMYLEKEEEEIDLAISQDSDKTLASFCKWQQTVNPKDTKNPNHHDIAVLLTRYDICADNMQSCGLMGLAYVAAACTSDKPCAINEDKGLILGVVVAHELGHVLGSNHDVEPESDCKAAAEDGSFHVMSPYVHENTNVWSTCSKSFITAFFDNDLGECLNDEPEVTLYQHNGMLPGAVYDANYQCNTDYPGSKVCKREQGAFCEMLWCQTSPKLCNSDGEPPADGTKCGENKWCYNKKCIEMGQRPEAVNGGWGEWRAYSKCTRTCGGGVAMSERECDNPKPLHRGRYCIGERRRFKICNPQLCPEGKPSFRAVQCSEFNSKPYQSKLYQWKPYMVEGDPCTLYCLNDDMVYVKLAPRAKDGTPCKSQTKNMCIAGICKNVGCDFVIDSEAVEDDCGVCKGDGTECKMVDKVFKSPPGRGYVKVAVIFRGCRNVLIQEFAPSANTIAITGPDEKAYYLNGNFVEQEDGVHAMGGAEGIYSHPEPDKEMLFIHGPLKENIVLFVVFYGAENVGYRYKYAEPMAKKASNYQPVYHWEFIDFQECSVRCGGGVALAEPKCIEEKAGMVSPTFCQATEKPIPKTKMCNEQACPAKWRIGKWGKCTGCRNMSGTRTREAECVRMAKVAGEDDVLVEDSECVNPKPGTKEVCNCNSASDKDGSCKRRGNIDEDYLPKEMMQRVWLQTVGNAPSADPKIIDLFSDTRNFNKVARDIRLHDRTRDKQRREDGEREKAPSVKVGCIVEDTIGADNIKLYSVPIKQSHNAVNLTDQAFVEMGDEVVDTLDMCNQKVLVGDEAAKVMAEFEHNNLTLPETT